MATRRPAPASPALLEPQVSYLTRLERFGSQTYDQDPMKLTRAAIVGGAAVLLIVSCSNAQPAGQSSTLSPDAQIAIKAVLHSSLAPGSGFPHHAGQVPCAIRGGGPAPGITIQGTCASAASHGDNRTWAVTLAESWDASDFHGADDPARGQLSHYWAFSVAVDGGLTSAGGGGHFPPQNWRR